MNHNLSPLLFVGFLLSLATGCVEPNFGVTTESKAQTHQQFMKERDDPTIVPVGAADIYERYSSTRDGYDMWWRFSIAENDFRSLVQQVAKDQEGPERVKIAPLYIAPAHWQAQADIPTWWKIRAGDHPLSIHWCHAAGEAERHQGWLFVYNQDTQNAWGWHWNHQWSSDECP